MRRTVLLLASMALTLLVASGVALAVTKIGTDGPDTLRGTNRADTLIGKGGNDILLALAGKDTLLGGPGKDVVLGGTERRALGGDKNLVGGDGNDFVGTGKGSDNAVGGEGNDYLFECCLREFSKDTLSGGSGFDRVIADRATLVAPDCEKVVVVHGSLEDKFRQADRFQESIPQSFFEGLNPEFFG